VMISKFCAQQEIETDGGFRALLWQSLVFSVRCG
jgi:hypothetical protein